MVLDVRPPLVIPSGPDGLRECGQDDLHHQRRNMSFPRHADQINESVGHVPTVDGSGYEWAEFGGMSSIPRRYHRLFVRCPESAGVIESSVLVSAVMHLSFTLFMHLSFTLVKLRCIKF